MSEYIYIAGDSPLQTGAVGEKPRLTKDSIVVYNTVTDMESFYFEENHDEEGEHFSFSPHFSLKKHQVSSLDMNLPRVGDKMITDSQKKAVDQLYFYIKDYFKRSVATKLEILFCLNGDEENTISFRKDVAFSKLKLTDLYYLERKLLTIKK
ncbi:hypothetical protein [Enterococcus termitis]|uniref:Uncharacterized protein n=1 Tax=Enterococcus termitis TaxID=332950 RepID=A0A1E5GDY7_9ENTE|nr:hypothetical protein [Enterococcus termitis]OEG10470.1 hypothetical protein BCR25_08300 [Enterococcus termitis]OJG97451.1 hypothetical protein RV18_GL000732 [Enterococcus termitis]